MPNIDNVKYLVLGSMLKDLSIGKREKQIVSKQNSQSHETLYSIHNIECSTKHKRMFNTCSIMLSCLILNAKQYKLKCPTSLA